MSLTTNNSHWYSADGHPCHSQEKKDGTFRKTHLGDARKLALLPSVTGILNVLAKPGLEHWRGTEYILATLRHPFREGMPDRAWVSEVKEKAMEQVDTAKSLGSLVHDALEMAIVGEPVATDLKMYVDPVLAWVKERNITIAEREEIVVSHEHGYAGKADVFFTWGKNGLGILDYKTRKTKRGEKIESYDGEAMQLAAYAAAHYGEANLGNVLAANVIISTTEPGRMEIIKHEDLEDEFEAFKACCTLWRHLKSYDPRRNGE